MRIPQQVSERVKEAPAQALRAVFSGIGQVLLVADRMKSRAAEPDHAPSGPAEPEPQPTGTMVRDETRWRSLDETGNVRLIPGEDTSKAKTAAASPAPEVTEASEVTEVVHETAVVSESPVLSEQSPAESPVVPEEPEESATSLPVPNYDNLTVPSLRARLRNLDTAQLHTLIDYEKAHAGRGDVLTMFERRIAKLESDGA
jgi:hypothetical protein